MRETIHRVKTTGFAALALAALCLLLPATAGAQWTPPDSSNNTSTTAAVNNVGVGTASPGDRLTVIGVGLFGNAGAHVEPYSNFNSQQNSSLEVGYGTSHSAVTPFASLVLSNNTTATSNAVGIIGQFSFVNRNITGASVDRRLSSIMSWVDGANNAGTLQFYTAAGGTLSERMRVSSGGNVGIGTASPQSRLHVEGGDIRVSGSGSAVVNFVDNAAGANQKLYQWRSEGGLFRMALLNDGNTGWAQQNILVANSAGNVGLGTADPATARLVIGGAAGQRGLDLASADQYAELRVIRNSLNAGDKDLYLQYQAGAGSKLHLFSDNAETMTVSGGNVGIGPNMTNPTHTLEVNGTINASQGITGATINATYQDVAEWVPSTQKLSAGTVVVLDTTRTNHVLASTKAYDTGVAGVVSDSPGVILGQGGADKLKVATTGRVKVRVDATRSPIKVGDLLVTSGVEGVAMKSVPVDLGGTPIHRPGTIIGKALEPLEKGTGEILVLLSLQ
jgi:hypothetical protein